MDMHMEQFLSATPIFNMLQAWFILVFTGNTRGNLKKNYNYSKFIIYFHVKGSCSPNF